VSSPSGCADSSPIEKRKFLTWEKASGREDSNHRPQPCESVRALVSSPGVTNEFLGQTANDLSGGIRCIALISAGSRT
jgi:hypothetical protein